MSVRKAYLVYQFLSGKLDEGDRLILVAIRDRLLLVNHGNLILD